MRAKTTLTWMLGTLLAVTSATNPLDLDEDRAVTASTPTTSIGTFDSRAVAIAFTNSASFGEYLVAQKADLDRMVERARERGDEQMIADLGALGPAMQRRLHECGFGTAPVDWILARIEDRLPALAEQAGVDVIVSKWELAYERPGTEFVDVTDLLAAEFEPSERTWTSIHQIVTTEPVPLDELKHDH